LQWMGVKDSKLLSPERREELFERIREIVHDFRVEVIEPDAIDMSMTESNMNLNWLEAETAARMVSEMNPDQIVIDCPSPNIKAYTEYVNERLSGSVQQKAELKVEHKADVNHVVVGAASIVAKVIRDRHINHLQSKIGYDFGSGYMSDPKTQKFLQEYHDQFPDLFRKKWQSYIEVVEKKKQRKLEEF